MTEVLFYHLERRSLEDVLPELLEKCLERGWRAVVETGSQERAEALDGHLWTYRDESFLPHGLAGGDTPERQPIVLTADTSNPNRATVRFVVDGAAPADIDAYERVIVLFDGGDEEAVGAARGWWKTIPEQGHSATYWQQDEAGRWRKKAETDQ